jgi:hypothetical protein
MCISEFVSVFFTYKRMHQHVVKMRYRYGGNDRDDDGGTGRRTDRDTEGGAVPKLSCQANWYETACDGVVTMRGRMWCG